METYKVEILLGLVQDELRSVRRGEISVGNAADNADHVETLREIEMELIQMRNGINPVVGSVSATSVVNIAGSNHGAIVM